MFEPLSRNGLYHKIVDQITESILTGRMRPGDQLPTETELAEQFNVSRTVVREAIKALSVQGLVQVTQGRGTFITQPPIEKVINSLQLLLTLDNHSFDDLMFARHLYEEPIARLAAQNATPDNLKVLKKCNDGMREAIGNAEQYMGFDVKFHSELALATKNTVLAVLIQPLFMMIQASRPIIATVPGKSERSLACHEKIYDAIAAHDPDAAVVAMREHLEQIARDRDLARIAAGGPSTTP